MTLSTETIQRLITPHIFLPSDATVGDAVRAYTHRRGKWWWTLVVQDGERYGICTYGSLLPYLTGRTAHIVHNIGNCAICSAMDPLLWRETGSLVDEVMVNEGLRARRLSEMPMALLPTVATEEIGEDNVFSFWWNPGMAVGLTLDGEWIGVHVDQMRDSGGVPAF